MRCRALLPIVWCAMPLFAQDAAPIEMLAGPGRPSTLLQEHLAAHREEFVVFDLGLFVQVLVAALTRRRVAASV